MFKQKRRPYEPMIVRDAFFATLAHLIGPIMKVVDLTHDGFQSIPFLIATTLIFLYFRDKSPFITHHARQALALQLMGTIGWFILVATGTAIWIVLLIVSVISILVLVGLVLVPIVLVSYPLFILASLTLPTSIVVLGLVGAWRTARGYNFDYPFLAPLLDRRLGVAYVRA